MKRQKRKHLWAWIGNSIFIVVLVVTFCDAVITPFFYKNCMNTITFDTADSYSGLCVRAYLYERIARSSSYYEFRIVLDNGRTYYVEYSALRDSSVIQDNPKGQQALEKRDVDMVAAIGTEAILNRNVTVSYARPLVWSNKIPMVELRCEDKTIIEKNAVYFYYKDIYDGAYFGAVVVAILASVALTLVAMFVFPLPQICRNKEKRRKLEEKRLKKEKSLEIERRKRQDL